MQIKRSRLAFALVFLTGCAGLIGVPDLTLDEDPADGGNGIDGGNASDGQVDGNVADTGSRDASNDVMPGFDAGDAATCDVSRLDTDANNCGRCGHSCLGSTCSAGLCQPTRLGVFSNAGTRFIAEHGDYVYFSTFWRSYVGDQGIYRIAKAGGLPEPVYVTDYTQQLTVVGNTLYFIVNDYPFDDAGPDGYQGGVWSCDLTAPMPCTPKIEVTADNPIALAVDNGVAYYASREQYDDKIRSHALDAGDIDASSEIGITESGRFLYFLWANGTDVYSLGGLDPADNVHAYVRRHPTVGSDGTGVELSRYTSPNANPGGMTGTATAVYYTAYDFDTTTGGTVRRVQRAGATTDPNCTYGNGSEGRPSGIYVDGTNAYWTNQGNPASPYANGSVAYCAAQGACCTAPNILWRGDGEPAAITGDDRYIYWLGYRSGEIWKLPKP